MSDCEQGETQFAFIGQDPELRENDYVYAPSERGGFLEMCIDGGRFRFDFGKIWTTKGMKRGVHIFHPTRCELHKDAVNSCSIILPEGSSKY